MQWPTPTVGEPWDSQVRRRFIGEALHPPAHLPSPAARRPAPRVNRHATGHACTPDIAKGFRVARVTPVASAALTAGVPLTHRVVVVSPAPPSIAGSRGNSLSLTFQHPRATGPVASTPAGSFLNSGSPLTMKFPSVPSIETGTEGNGTRTMTGAKCRPSRSRSKARDAGTDEKQPEGVTAPARGARLAPAEQAEAQRSPARESTNHSRHLGFKLVGYFD